MARGLISELGDFHLQHNKRLLTNSEATHTHGDYTRGVFQCIGFKEFHDYLLMSREERDDKKGQKSLEKGKGLYSNITPHPANNTGGLVVDLLY